MSQADEGGPELKDLSAARDLFFSFEGSRFYMSRNDVESVYLSYNVPLEVERRWLSELTDQKLGMLQSPGNWWSINFLLSHRDGRHLSDVLQARPRGVLWQRTAFVEEQLSYVEMCLRLGCSIGEARTGIEQVLANARALLSSCRSDRTRGRVNQLIAKAEQARLVLGAAGSAQGQ
jgi:hypothetical protein